MYRGSATSLYDFLRDSDWRRSGPWIEGRRDGWIYRLLIGVDETPSGFVDVHAFSPTGDHLGYQGPAWSLIWREPQILTVQLSKMVRGIDALREFGIGGAIGVHVGKPPHLLGIEDGLS